MLIPWLGCVTYPCGLQAPISPPDGSGVRIFARIRPGFPGERSMRKRSACECAIARRPTCPCFGGSQLRSRSHPVPSESIPGHGGRIFRDRRPRTASYPPPLLWHAWPAQSFLWRDAAELLDVVGLAHELGLAFRRQRQIGMRNPRRFESQKLSTWMVSFARPPYRGLSIHSTTRLGNWRLRPTLNMTAGVFLFVDGLAGA